MLLRGFGLAFVAGVAFVLAPVPETLAQEAGTEALGTPLGAFILYPSLTVGTEYNDNIFATDGNEEDDIIFRISPELRLVSDWDNHALEFVAAGDLTRYYDNSSEDTSGYRFLSNGRLDILRDTFATGNVGVAQTFEERGSPDDVNGEEPTKELTYGGELGLSHRFNRAWLELNGGIAWRNFDDVDAAGAGEINNDDRDRTELSSRARVGYDFNPDIGAFVQGTFNRVRYEDSADDNGFNRDSSDYGLATGIRLDLTELIFGDFFVGLTRSEFDDSRFDTQTTWEIGGDVTWDVTALTTANFSASRSWEETTVSGSSSALTTTAGATVTHSLTDTVTLDGAVNYTRESFEETNRIDNTYSLGPSASYIMNRFLNFSLSYTYTQRKSDAVGQDYTENRILFTTRLQY